MNTIPHTVQLVHKWLLDSQFCSSEFGMSELFEETLVILQVRPKLIESFATLYFSLFGPAAPQSYFKEHKSTLLHYFFTPTIFHLQLPSQSLVLHFLRKLFQLHLFSIKDILNEVHNLVFNEIEQDCFSFHLYFWFAPEIDPISPDYIHANVGKHNLDTYLPYKSLRAFHSNMKELQKNNYELLKQYINCGTSIDPSFIYAKYDDIEHFMHLYEDVHFNIEEPLPPAIFSDSIMVSNQPSLIQWCAFYGSSSVFKYLILSGAEIPTYDGKISIAQFAVAGGNLEIIQILQGIGVSFVGTLPVAAAFHRHDLFLWLYSTHFPDINVTDPVFSSVLHQCASCSNIRTLLFCFQLSNCTVNIRDDNDLTPLHYSCDNNRYIITKLLLEHPLIKVNSVNSLNQTPLFLASSHGSCKIVELFKKMPGIDPNKRNDSLMTPLHEACAYGYENVVKCLLTFSDIDINLKNINKLTPLHIAAMKGFTSITKLLITHEGIQVNAKGTNGKTALMMAVQNEQIETISLLLKDKSVNINCQDDDGNTALHISIILKKEDIFNLLITHPKINVNLTNKTGVSPIFLAISKAKSNIVKMLLETNKVDLKLTLKQKTAQAFAIDSKCEPIIQIFESYLKGIN